jgi:hypothetical protein
MGIYLNKKGKYKLLIIQLWIFKLSLIILTLKKVSFRIEIEWGWDN